MNQPSDQPCPECNRIASAIVGSMFILFLVLVFVR